MFKSYLKIAWRTILRRKAFSAINIFGLSIGLAVFSLICLFVLDELSYDKHHEHAHRIYRINTNIRLSGTEFRDRTTPAPMAATLVRDYPQIEQAVRLSGGNDILVKKGEETVIEKNAFFADSTLFQVFTLPMLAGNPRTALSGPESMVISASMAEKYFNTTAALGKTLKVDNSTFYTITGVIEDMPPQSHFHLNFIRSMAGRESARSDFWLSNSFDTYVLLQPGITQATLDGYLKETAKRYAEPQVINLTHSSFSDLERKGDYLKYFSIPITKIHLYSPLSSELEPSGNIEYVYISAVIGLFILLIACINFMNLSTAQSTGRAKEVGVRKVIGSGRAGLIRQFLTESMLSALIAFLFSLILIAGLLPLLNTLAGKQMVLLSDSLFWMIPSLLCLALFCGVLAGTYPAFVLSAFNPGEVLKGKFVLNIKGYKLRNALVVFQFTTAIVLISGTLIIYNQLDYIRAKDLGYKRDQVLVLQNAYSLGEHALTFKEEILQLPGVMGGSIAGNLPTTTANDWNREAYSKDPTMTASQTQTLVDWTADAGYINALGMKIVKGRNFSEDMPTDASAVIINESAARQLGFKDPLNAKVYGFNTQQQQTLPFHIIGIVKDFNAGSLRYATEPLLIRYSKYGGQFIFKIKGDKIPELINEIERRYRSFEGMSSQPFLYSFLDEDFNNLYQSEQRTGQLFVAFAVLAIFIACLGLFALASFSTEQRTKEVGIRKVLGASVAGIVGLLSRDFITLVGVAILVATPLAWWAMSKWLESFAYRINIHWSVFIASGAIAIAIALLAIGFKAVNAALANPTRSLRSE